MLGNQLLNSVPGFEEDLNRLKRVDFMYTTCEAGKRRSVNHARACSRSPRRARGRGRGRGEARPAGRAVRCACAAGRDVQVRCDVMC